MLVSQATETLLADEEHDLEIEFRPLGQHRLKDLDRPVTLYQVAAADLPSRFPPPRAQEPGGVARLRRPLVLIPAALAVAAVAAVAALVALGGGDGGLSSVDPNNVGVIDASTNKILTQVPVGIRPGPIAAVPGVVWVGNLDDRTLTRLDARKRNQVANVPLDNRTPTGLAANEAAAWVAQGRIGSVVRVDPQYNQAGDPTAVTRPSSSGSGSVALGGGSIWAVFGNSTLVRIDPDSGRVAERGYAGGGPSGITYAEEAVWVANGDDSTYWRFNPATFETGPVATRSVGSRPSAIAYGEGSIWTANAGDGTVWRINPASLASTAIPVGRGPSAIAVGAGAAWVANSGDGTVSRIDPKTNTVVKTIHTGNLPAGVAVEDGLVWVTVQAR